MQSWQGAGKTCLINWAVSSLGEEFFPVIVPVRMGGSHDAICTDPAEFVQFLLSRILAATRDARKVTAKQHERFRAYLSGQITVRRGKHDRILSRLSGRLSWIPGFAQSAAEAGGQIERFVEQAITQKLYADDHVGCLNEVVEILRDKGSRLTIVLDDTDKFLVSGAIDLTALVEKFFLYVVPFFAEIQCPIVFPTHETYTAHGVYQTVKNRILDTVVTIPELPFDAFWDLLRHKVHSLDPDLEMDELIEPRAIELVFHNQYQGKTEERMRSAVRSLREAVRAAVADGDTRITLDRMAFQLLG